MQNKMPKQVGVLEKWSPALFKNFKNKYVVLENKILKYYKLEDSGEPILKGALNFDLYLVSVRVSNSKP